MPSSTPSKSCLYQFYFLKLFDVLKSPLFEKAQPSIVDHEWQYSRALRVNGEAMDKTTVFTVKEDSQTGLFAEVVELRIGKSAADCR